MRQIRKASERGHFNFGWLNTYHTFSFGDYHDPAHMGFQSLRVINEDWVQPGQGFGMHFHRDMEIITYVLEGTLQHKDSMGNGSEVRAGELQRMSAGTGIQHSEFNPSDREAVHLYQIWLFPQRRGLKPSYEQKIFSPEEKKDRWRVVASPDGREDSLTIHQDALLSLADLTAGQQLEYSLSPGRHAWLQVVRGTVEAGDQSLTAGDGAAISEEKNLVVSAQENAEVLLFDLAELKR